MKTTWEQVAFKRRIEVLDLIYQNKAGHIGGDMSCMDILVCLYYRVMDLDRIRYRKPDRDYFILSKGHCAEALYTVLADLGFISKDQLNTFAQLDTALAQHPTRKIPGVELATGSLGHGLSLGAGIALACQRDGLSSNVYVLMGDGEQDEGSVWEAAMAAGKYHLDHLVAIIDRNGLQISGTTEDVMPLDDLAQKYNDFGWRTVICNGHDSDQIYQALTEYKSGKPTVIVAATQKGYGSTVMQNTASWHHQVPTEEMYQTIRKELLQQAGFQGR